MFRSMPRSTPDDLAWVALVLGAGAAMVADRPLAEAFGAGSVGFGPLIGAWGLGSAAGSLAGRVLDARTEPRGSSRAPR